MTTATLYASVIDARMAANPEETYRVLSKFKPELILMDGYMPYCSGLVRQCYGQRCAAGHGHWFPALVCQVHTSDTLCRDSQVCVANPNRQGQLTHIFHKVLTLASFGVKTFVSLKVNKP